MPLEPSPSHDMDGLWTAKDAAEYFHTTINVILMWRNRGWTEDGERKSLAVADRRDGRPLYRWGDLLDAERGTRRSRQRTGLPRRAVLASPYERRKVGAVA